MGSPAPDLFTPDEIQGKTTQQAPPPPQVGGDLFSPEELQQGQGAPTAGMLSQANQIAGDVAVGAGKGALQTVNTISGLLNKIPGVGEALAPSVGVKAAQQAATPTGTAQQVGVGAETLAEFLLGDEALKGLSLGDKLLNVQKIADVYEKSSAFGKAAIEHGMNMLRGATVGAGTSAAKGESPEAGAAMGAAAEPIKMAGGLAGKAVRSVWPALPDIPAEAVNKVQPDLQQGLRDIADKIAQDAGVKADPGTGELRHTYAQVADALEAKSKALYKPIDDVTQNEFTNVQNKIKNVERQMQFIAGTDPTAEERLYSQKVALNVRLGELIDVAKKAGVDPKTADQAAAAWMHRSAVADLDIQVKGAMPGHMQARGEVVDPNSFAKRIQGMHDTGRLVQATGGDQPTANAMRDLGRKAIRDTEDVKAAGEARQEAIKAREKAEKTRSGTKKTAAITVGTALGVGGLTKGAARVAEAIEK